MKIIADITARRKRPLVWTRACRSCQIFSDISSVKFVETKTNMKLVVGKNNPSIGRDTVIHKHNKYSRRTHV